jgi:hypothetical protein
MTKCTCEVHGESYITNVCPHLMRAARDRDRNVAYSLLQTYFEDGAEFLGWTICVECKKSLSAEGFPDDKSLTLMRDDEPFPFGEESLSPWGKRLDELGFMTSIACYKCLDECLIPKEPQ